MTLSNVLELFNIELYSITLLEVILLTTTKTALASVRIYFTGLKEENYCWKNTLLFHRYRPHYCPKKQKKAHTYINA